MDPALALKALIMGVVEGLTEFLPVSSTGHLIIAGSLLDFHDEKAKVFELVIQTGAMLAVCWEFRARFLGVLRGMATDATAQGFVLNLVVAFMPAAVIGLALGAVIKAHLFNAVAVAIALIAGGLVILWVERRERPARIDDVDRMGWRDALKVGFAQAFALFPGVSRAGATIVGGMLFGLSRRAATEFSFFLAVPTLMAAGAYDLYRNRTLFSADDIGLFGIGTVSAFISAFISIRWLMRYVATHNFRIFAWYRIGFGLFILGSAYTGAIAW
jgi:undecaprenyl-diphosphatase